MRCVHELVKEATIDNLQIFQAYLDKSTPFTVYRWAGTGVLFIAFAVRIFVAEGWYIGMRIAISIR